jgi:hypothetical protein
LGAALLLAGGSSLRAAETETRDFAVFVDGKPAGEGHITVHKQEDGSVVVNSNTDVVVRILLIEYRYKFRGREVWKDGRLTQLDSTCNDDGKAFVVSAAAEGNSVRLKVTAQSRTEEHLVRGDVWLTSFWAEPEKRVNQEVPIIDVDTGKELSGRLNYVGIEQRQLAGQTVNLSHYRLTGKVERELWYDGAKRLVRQEWIEDGHRTLVELTRLRR